MLAICGSEDDGTPKFFHLDYDHSCCRTSREATKCGKCIRGVLCRNCNYAEGLLRSDPKIAKAMAEYLEAFVGSL